MSAEIKGRPAVTVPHGRRRSLAVLWGDLPAPGDMTAKVKRWVPARGARGPVRGSWARPERVPMASVVLVVDGPHITATQRDHITDARMSVGWS